MTEDLDVFLQDFGVDVSTVIDGETVESIGILDTPDKIDELTLSIATEWALIVKTSVFGTLPEGSEITVDGLDYVTTLTPLKLSDGKFCVLSLKEL